MLRLRPLRILFDVYKPQFWYWEVIETIYRLSLTGVLVLINQGSSLQIIVGLLFSLLFIRIYETSCPFDDEALQRIKNISLVCQISLPCLAHVLIACRLIHVMCFSAQWQIFFIFGCALLINGEFVDKSNIVVVVFTIFIIFVNFLVDLVRWLCFAAKKTNEEVSERLSEMRGSFSTNRISRVSETSLVVSPLAALGSRTMKPVDTKNVELAHLDMREREKEI